MDRLAESFSKNHILANLTDDEFERLRPHLEPVELNQGHILYEIGAPIDCLYFPLNAMISLVTEMADGKIVEVGLVGSDGASGVARLMGRETSFERAIVQIPNGGARLNVAVAQEEFQKGGNLQTLFLAYMAGLMRQVAQTAACNASHTTEERLSRWLLMCHDRIGSARLQLTQEFLAEMLGTRRATVNVAAITLQAADLIQYSRGLITIIDRPGLEAFSCECYRILKNSNGL